MQSVLHFLFATICFFAVCLVGCESKTLASHDVNVSFNNTLPLLDDESEGGCETTPAPALEHVDDCSIQCEVTVSLDGYCQSNSVLGSENGREPFTDSRVARTDPVYYPCNDALERAKQYAAASNWFSSARPNDLPRVCGLLERNSVDVANCRKDERKSIWFSNPLQHCKNSPQVCQHFDPKGNPFIPDDSAAAATQ